MPFLRWPHCPVCGAEVALARLWEAAPTSRYNILIGRIGISCPSCSARLRILQARTKLLAALLMFGPPAVLVCWLTLQDPPKELFGFVAIAVGSTAIGLLFVLPRHFARLRPVQTDERVEYPLEARGSDA